MATTVASLANTLLRQHLRLETEEERISVIASARVVIDVQELEEESILAVELLLALHADVVVVVVTPASTGVRGFATLAGDAVPEQTEEVEEEDDGEEMEALKVVAAVLVEASKELLLVTARRRWAAVVVGVTPPVEYSRVT